jgi:high-affinity Fe2+/Pb2+ permease
MVLPETDTGVYIVSGLFALAVFVAAIAFVVSRTAVELTTGTMLTLSAGFVGFIAVYFIAMVVYREIDDREQVR